MDIIKSNNLQTSSILYMLSSATTWQTLSEQMDIINEVFYHNDAENVVAIEDFMHLQPNILRYTVIIFVDSYESFK